jgi:GxxExxY protein
MADLIYKDESFKIIGLCMEVHSILGPGFQEVVYKDALEYEFQKHGIPYEREKKFSIRYKDSILKREYIADFVVYNRIILEAKAVSQMPKVFKDICINYCRVSNCALALLVNFGEESLVSKRVVLGEKYSPWMIPPTKEK